MKGTHGTNVANVTDGTDGTGEILSLEAVNVSLGGREVLSDVSFAIGQGELVGLIGSNGAGKTTLLKVVLGVVPPQSGSVLVAGRPRTRRQRLVGYLPQQTVLEPDLPMRARDLVALGLDGHRLGVGWPSAARRERVEQMLEAVGASAFADARVGTLSGGEQQRVLIAHALIAQPKLLLLDEPLANLDPASAQDVVGVLARVRTEQHVAVLVSTHDINALLPVMDRVVYVANRHVACGTPDEVVRTDSLSRLYGQHVDVVRVHGRVIVVAGSEALGYRHTGGDGSVVEVV